MRAVASLVAIAIVLGPHLTAADGLDLSDLERAAQGNGADAARWTQRRERMRADFAKVTALAERLTAEQRVQAWQRFLAAYADKDPFDGSDEELRARARAAIGAGAAPGQTTPPAVAGGTADPVQLERLRTAYQQAKSTDLHPGPAAAKRTAWEAFLAVHGTDLPGTDADDEMRRWAQIRLDGLAQDPPVSLPPAYRVIPGFAVEQGTQVSAIEAASLAERLGLHLGDTIIAAGDPPHDLVGNPEALAGYIAGLRRDDELRLVVIRDHGVMAMPAGAARPSPRGAAPARAGSALGVHCLQTADSLVVGAVDPGEIAEMAGLDAGDRIVACNRSAIATMEALDAAAKGLAGEAALELDVLRCGILHRVAIPAAGGAAAWTALDADAGWTAAPPPPPRPVVAAPAEPIEAATAAAAPAPAPAAQAAPATTPSATSAAPAPAAARPAPSQAELERAAIAHPGDPAAAMRVALGIAAGGAAAAPGPAKPAINLGVQYEARDDGVLRVTARAANGIAAKLGVQVGDMVVGAGEPSRVVRGWNYDQAMAGCIDAQSTRLVIARTSASSGKSVRRVAILPLPPPPGERAPRAPHKRFTALWSLGFETFDIIPIVVATDAGELAEAIGLMPGDRITAIAGRTTAIMDDVREALQLADASTPALRLAVTTWDGVDWQVDIPRAGGLAAWQRVSPHTRH